MSARPSRFGSLAQAVKDRTAASAEAPRAETAGQGATDPPAPGCTSRPRRWAPWPRGCASALRRLEAELAQASGRNTELERALGQARSAASRAGEAVEEFLFLDPAAIRDELPRDRLPGAFAGAEFEALLADIQENGQNDAITVRPAADGHGFEVAAGRRRLEACRRLGRQVLARSRPLDEAAMLRVQFSENERREDISALERSRWFAEVKTRLDLPSKDIAQQFGLDPSTLSLYLRLARFPAEIVERLAEPRRLSVLRARRVMESLEADGAALPRILAALDAQGRGGCGSRRADRKPDAGGRGEGRERPATRDAGARPAACGASRPAGRHADPERWPVGLPLRHHDRRGGGPGAGGPDRRSGGRGRGGDPGEALSDGSKVAEFALPTASGSFAVQRLPRPPSLAAAGRPGKSFVPGIAASGAQTWQPSGFGRAAIRSPKPLPGLRYRPEPPRSADLATFSGSLRCRHADLATFALFLPSILRLGAVRPAVVAGSAYRKLGYKTLIGMGCRVCVDNRTPGCQVCAAGRVRRLPSLRRPSARSRGRMRAQGWAFLRG